VDVVGFPKRQLNFPEDEDDNIGESSSSSMILE
jgi:hypothetical protein